MSNVFVGRLALQRIRIMRLLISVVVFGSVLQASVAFGQSCVPFVNQMISEGGQGKTLYFSMVSSQANRLSTVESGWAFWDGVAMDSNGWGVDQRFSDRYQQIPALGTDPAFTQNLSYSYPNTEQLRLRFSRGTAGDLALFVQNLAWGYQISFQSLSCSDGVIYGFGSPIGNANAGRPAMYVIRYYFDYWIG